MCSDDDGGGGGAGYLDEVPPDGLSQEGVHPHCGLIQYEKLRLLEQSNRQAGSPANSRPCYTLLLLPVLPTLDQHNINYSGLAKGISLVSIDSRYFLSSIK